MQAQTIRIVVADEHAVVRAGLRLILEGDGRLAVVGEADTGRKAVALARQTRPDIVLLDLALDGGTGADIVPDVIATSQGVRVLVLTGILDASVHRRALVRGAMGVVTKNESAATVIKAIYCVQSGEAWVDRTTLGRMLTDLRHVSGHRAPAEEQAPVRLLSDREREVVALVGQGLRNRTIGERLFISETTVRHHMTAIFSKLGVSDRLHLVLFAQRCGLVPPHDH